MYIYIHERIYTQNLIHIAALVRLILVTFTHTVSNISCFLYSTAAHILYVPYIIRDVRICSCYVYVVFKHARALNCVDWSKQCVWNRRTIGWEPFANLHTHSLISRLYGQYTWGITLRSTHARHSPFDYTYGQVVHQDDIIPGRGVAARNLRCSHCVYTNENVCVESARSEAQTHTQYCYMGASFSGRDCVVAETPQHIIILFAVLITCHC